MHPAQRGEDEAGLPTTRLEALSDGVFAIAMTLLVLDLRVPELASDATEAELASALTALAPNVASFGVGFVVLGTLWVGQHAQFNHLRRLDRVLVWMNLAFLLLVSSLPFAVALVGRFWASTAATALYASLLLAAGTMLAGNWAYANHRGRWVRSSATPAVVRAVSLRIAFGMVGYAVAFVLAFFAPLGSLILFASVPLAYLVPTGVPRPPERSPS